MGVVDFVSQKTILSIFFWYKNHLLPLENVVVDYILLRVIFTDCKLQSYCKSQTQLQSRIYLKAQSNEQLHLKTQLYF